MSKPKRIKIIIKNLSKEKCVGLAWIEDQLIELDPNQTEREFLLTAIHESLHILFPKYSEKKIISLEKSLGSVIWRLGFRNRKFKLKKIK
jgi:hypothetical protein